MCVCVCIRIQTGDLNNRGTIVPALGGVPGFILPMRTSLNKQWENNERSPIEGVYMCVCACVCLGIQTGDL